MTVQDLALAPARPVRAALSSLAAAVREARRLHRDRAAMDAMPRDRLADMGLPGGDDHARRLSGEAGLPRFPHLW